VSLENTANRGGGSCYDLAEIKRIQALCKEQGLAFHLDGARLFNALVAKKHSAKQFGEVFDTISICLSKGLGTPVGSVLLGPKDFIKKARRVRKVFGGGMRQAGYIAAAGVYALERHVDRLAEDHAHAQEIAEALRTNDFTGEIFPVETNIIIFEVKGRMTSKDFVEKMKQQDILMFAISPTHVRMVVHLDITPAKVSQTIKTINEL
jgi:threonine aldolase